MVTKQQVLEALNQIKLSQTGWENREDVMTFNGKPIGGTISPRREIDRWWPELKQELARFLAEKLSEREKGGGTERLAELLAENLNGGEKDGRPNQCNL